MKCKQKYIRYLNNIGESLDDSFFIIGGKKRNRYDGYGNLLKKFDPIAFHEGFNEWYNDFMSNENVNTTKLNKCLPKKSKLYSASVVYSFKCVFNIKADNLIMAKEYASKHCAAISPVYQSSITDDWTGDVHPFRKTIKIKLY